MAQGYGIKVSESGYASSDAGLTIVSPQQVRDWLHVEQMRAWARGDATRAHYCTAALNGEPGELEAILNDLPSPGVADGSARREL